MTQTFILIGVIFVTGYALGVLSGMAVRWHWKDDRHRPEPIELDNPEPVIHITRLTSRNSKMEI